MKVVEGDFTKNTRSFDEGMAQLLASLEKAKEDGARFEDFAFVAYGEDGEMLYSSNTSAPDALFMLELFKQYVVDSARGE